MSQMVRFLLSLYEGPAVFSHINEIYRYPLIQNTDKRRDAGYTHTCNSERLSAAWLKAKWN